MNMIKSLSMLIGCATLALANTVLNYNDPAVQADLAKIAMDDTKETMERLRAIYGLKNDALLAELAESENTALRKAAVYRLSGHTIAKHVYDKDAEVRRSAVQNRHFNDQLILADLAKNDVDYIVRALATGKLEDKIVLADIAKNDENGFVRYTATKNLNDKELLLEFAKNDKDGPARLFAVQWLGLKDKALLEDFVRQEGDDWVRLGAAIRLDDQELLAEIARNGQGSDERERRDIRTRTLGHIKDKAVLADIALTIVN